MKNRVVFVTVESRRALAKGIEHGPADVCENLDVSIVIEAAGKNVTADLWL